MSSKAALVLTLLLICPSLSFGSTARGKTTTVQKRGRSKRRAARRSARRKAPRRTRGSCKAKATSCPKGWTRSMLKTSWCQRGFTVCTRRYGKMKGRPETATILLHGLGGQAHDWVKYAKVGRLAEALLAKRRLPPGVLVAVSGGNGYWTDWARAPQRFGTLVHQDLRRHLKKRGLLPRDGQQVALVGVSAGAFGALSLGLRFPNKFGRILALSPTDMVIATQSKGPSAVYKRVFGSKLPQARIRKLNPKQLAEKSTVSPHRIVLRWGSAEPAKFSTGGRELRAALAKRTGVSLQAAEIREGRHGWRTWRLALGPALVALWTTPTSER